MKLFHVTVVGGEAEREEFRFLLERELNAQGVAFTDDPNKADGTIRGTIRVTSALPMWAFATATVRGKDGKVLWRDYFKSNQLEGVAEQAAKAIFGQCQKGWPQ